MKTIKRVEIKQPEFKRGSYSQLWDRMALYLMCNRDVPEFFDESEINAALDQLAAHSELPYPINW